ncbi:MAG: hypothetical protein RLZZ306_2915, partial [Bacteroidota bacterium]
PTERRSPLSLKRGALSQIKALPFKGKGWDGVFRQILYTSVNFLSFSTDNEEITQIILMINCIVENKFLILQSVSERTEK